MAAIAGPVMLKDAKVRQQSSKSAKHRCTEIARVSTASSPAVIHTSRSAAIRETSAHHHGRRQEPGASGILRRKPATGSRSAPGSTAARQHGQYDQSQISVDVGEQSGIIWIDVRTRPSTGSGRHLSSWPQGPAMGLHGMVGLNDKAVLPLGTAFVVSKDPPRATNLWLRRRYADSDPTARRSCGIAGPIQLRTVRGAPEV